MSEITPVAPVAPAETDDAADYLAFEEERKGGESSKTVVVEPTDKTPKGGEQSRTETASPPGEDEKEPEHSSKEQKAAFARMRLEAKEGKQAKEELDRLKRTAARPAQTTETRQTERTSEAPKPFADPEPELDDFNTVPEWKTAQKEWLAKRDLAIKAEAQFETRREFHREQTDRVRQASEAENKRLGGLFSAKAEVLKKDPAFADIDDVIKDSNVPMTDTMFRFYAEDEQGARVAHHMATHPVDALNISMLPPKLQEKALGDLRDTLTKGSTKETNDAPPRKTYKPPTRANPGSSVPSNDPMDTEADDYRGFEQLVKQKQGR